MNCWSESWQEILIASISLSLSPRKRQLEDSEVFERMKSFKLSQFKQRCAFATFVCVALGSVTNKACNLCICSLVLLIFEVFPLRNDCTGNSCLFLSYLTPMFALRTSWDLFFFFFFFVWMAKGRAVPILRFPAHTQSKTASGFWNNYLNLPPIVMLDHKPGLYTARLMHCFSHTCCQFLSDAATAKLAKLRTAFHFIISGRLFALSLY